MKKPKQKLCWECGKKLYQNKVCIKKIVDGHERMLHKFCATMIERGHRMPELDDEAYEEAMKSETWGFGE